MKREKLILLLFLTIIIIKGVNGASFAEETIISPWINDTYTINFNESYFITPLVVDFKKYNFPERWNCEITRVEVKSFCPENTLCISNTFNISNYTLIKNSTTISTGFYLAQEGENSLQFTCCQSFSEGTECFILDRAFFVLKNNSLIDNIQLNQNNYNQRITLLESWKQQSVEWAGHIEDWMGLTEGKFLEILFRLSNVENKTKSIEVRISKIENRSNTNETTSFIDHYLKYLSSTDRKNMLCGYAKENHLTSINDLGLNCTITYKSTRGKETSNCKCR